MHITPRKQEIGPVVDLLESDQFEDSRGMAVSIIKTVARSLSLRDTYGVAIGFKGDKRPGLALGPAYTLRGAKNMAQEAQEAGMEARIARLSGTGSIKAASTLKRACANSDCGHRKELHAFGTCAVAGCKCGGWEQK